MNQTQGSVQNFRIDQEGSTVVMRFVLEQNDGTLTPIEMRGSRVNGVLADGDNVLVTEQKLDRDGVLRPNRVQNLTTNSMVQVGRRGLVRRMPGMVFGLIGSATLSIGSGVIITILLGGNSDGGSFPIRAVGLSARSAGGSGSGSGGGSGSGSSDFGLEALLAGLTITLVVFFLIYFLPRILRKRKA